MTFKDTNIQIFSEGQRHLGAVIGSVKYKHDYIQEKIDLWTRELRVLCKIASTEPHAAYTGFITGFKHKVSYYMRTIPNISDQLKKFDDVVSTEFLPAITGGINCSDICLLCLFHQNSEGLVFKNKIKATKQQRYKIDLDTIRLTLNEEQKRLNDLNVEQGASSWLITKIRRICIE